ncbi:HK97-gp10 family putative phage morphogenesis protein [Alkalihalobacillus sp. NPDC078783]
MSNVKVTGEAELIRELEKRYGKEAMQRRVDAALVKGAEVFKKELKREFEKFKDTGASVLEITVSSPLDYGGKRAVRIHWRGDKGRYRIIHLNEFGTVKNPNPKGKGAIAKAERAATEAYFRTIKEELGRG